MVYLTKCSSNVIHHAGNGFLEILEKVQVIVVVLVNVNFMIVLQIVVLKVLIVTVLAVYHSRISKGHYSKCCSSIST